MSILDTQNIPFANLGVDPEVGRQIVAVIDGLISERSDLPVDIERAAKMSGHGVATVKQVLYSLLALRLVKASVVARTEGQLFFWELGVRVCPLCGERAQGHPPDGRCDACAEEHGCTCGCFPSPLLVRMLDRFCPDGWFEHDDDGRWRIYYNDQRNEVQELTLGKVNRVLLDLWLVQGEC